MLHPTCPLRWEDRQPRPIETVDCVQLERESFTGRVKWIVTPPAQLHVTRTGGHIDLVTAAGYDYRQGPWAAGEAHFTNGVLRWIDNRSGHYQPHGLTNAQLAFHAFKQAGCSAPAYRYVELQWNAIMSAYVPTGHSFVVDQQHIGESPPARIIYA